MKISLNTYIKLKIYKLTYGTSRFIIFHYFHCDKIVPQVSDSDKTKMEEAIDEKIKWLEENQDTDTEDYKTQKKELEDIVQPIIAKL